MRSYYNDFREKTFFAKSVLTKAELESELSYSLSEYDRLQEKIKESSEDIYGDLQKLKSVENYVRVIIETLHRKYKCPNYYIKALIKKSCMYRTALGY